MLLSLFSSSWDQPSRFSAGLTGDLRPFSPMILSYCWACQSRCVRLPECQPGEAGPGEARSSCFDDGSLHYRGDRRRKSVGDVSKGKGWGEYDTVCRSACELMVDESRGEFREVLGMQQEGAVLVRPDGYIAWRFVGSALDIKEAELKSLASVLT